jgi:hypothetical protein
MKFRHVRWWIVGFLLLISILNYVDRQMFSILAPTIQADLGMSDAEYGRIVSYFLAAYTVSYLVSGRIMDAVGARIGMAFSLGLWSAASALTGLARGIGGVGWCRACLGLFEAGGYTASPKGRFGVVSRQGTGHGDQRLRHRRLRRRNNRPDHHHRPRQPVRLAWDVPHHRRRSDSSSSSRGWCSSAR